MAAVFWAERWTDLVVPLVSYLAWSVLAVLIDIAAVVKDDMRLRFIADETRFMFSRVCVSLFLCRGTDWRLWGRMDCALPFRSMSLSDHQHVRGQVGWTKSR